MGVIISEIVRIVSSCWRTVVAVIAFAGIAVLAVAVSVYVGQWLCEKILK